MKCLTVIVFLFVEIIGFGQSMPFQKDKGQLEQFANKNRTQNAFGFIENKGQIVDQDGNPNPAVKYLLNIPGFNIQLRAKGWSYDTYVEESKPAAERKIGNRTAPAPPPRHYHRVDVELRYTNPDATMMAEDPNSDFLNYYTSDLHPEGFTGVRHFRKVTYKNIYENIDLIFKNTPEHGVEYDFIIHPGGDPDDIVLDYSGQNEIVFKDNNSFDVRVAHGIFSESIPRSYLDDFNSIQVGYVQRDENSFGFSVPAYDREKTLVIDPVPSRIWYTFYGGNGNDHITGMDYDATFQIMYLAGYTESSTNIATGGAQFSFGGGLSDAMVVKLDLVGARIWGTYIGGIGDDYAVGVAVDGSGDTYIAGQAGAASGTFTSGGSFQNSFGGGTSDAFVMKLKGTDGSKVWGTYYGGVGDDGANAIAVAGSSVYVAGSTTSSGLATTNLYNSGSEIFVVKFPTSGGGRNWATYVGGSLDEYGAGINADGAGAVYVFGQAASSGLATTGQTIQAGGSDAILVRLDDSAGSFVWSTYLGGDGDEGASYMDLVAGSDIYCTGYTTSTGTQMSTTGAFQETYGGGIADIFLTKFSAATGAKVWSTYYGGSGDDENTGAIDADALSNIIIGGYTSSIDIPGHTFLSGGYDGLLAKFNSSGVRQWGMDIGGLGTSDDDYVYAVKFEGNRPWLAGETNSTNLGLATGAFQQSNGGGFDGVVMRFNSDTPTGAPTSLTFPTVGSTTIDASFTVEASASNYLAIRKAGSAPTGTPTEGTTYTAGSTMGDGTVAYVGTGNTFTDTGLTPATAYYYKIFSFNGSGSATTYFTTPLAGNATTIALATVPTAQPTALTFANITTTTFDISFTAASPAPDGYIGIAALDLASLTGTLISDGVTYSSGDGVGTGSAFVSFVGTGTLYNATGANPGTTLYYQIYSYNDAGSGLETNYNLTTPLTGNVTTTTDDTTDPVIVSNSTPTSVAPRTNVPVTGQFSDPESGITTATIYYARSSDVKSYNDVTEGTMTHTTGNTYTFTIPGTVLDEPGAFYYFYLVNGAGLYVYSTDYEVAVQFPASSSGLTIPFNGFGTDQTDYRIVSVPLNPSTATVGAVFGDDLGADDKSVWRIFHYQGGNTASLSSTSLVQLGQSYWLLAKTSKTIDTGPGITTGVSLSQPFKIPISAGWNQIGDPYPYTVDWQSILDLNSNPSEITKFKVYKGSWDNGTRLEKFSGGFVFANASLTGGLEIPIYKDPSIQSGRLADPQPDKTLNAIDQEDWEVIFNLKNGTLSNHFGGIGMNPLASDGFDRLDDINLPRFLDYIELSHRKEILGYHFSKDVVPVSANHEWDFSVETSLFSPTQLEWDNSYFGNNSKELILWDVSQQLAIDMRQHTSYHVDPAAGRSFKVFFGEGDYVKERALADRLLFHSVFPNPSAGKFTFAFSTPDRPDDKWVSLEVIDMLGRKVATIAEGNYPAGYHEVTWEPVDNYGSLLPGNMYIARLKTSTSEIPKKIILK